MKRCHYCKRPYTEADLIERRKTKVQRLRESFALAKKEGRHIGRKRKADYEAIRKLRSNGLTMHDICQKLKCSISSVQRAIEEMK